MTGYITTAADQAKKLANLQRKLANRNISSEELKELRALEAANAAQADAARAIYGPGFEPAYDGSDER